MLFFLTLPLLGGQPGTEKEPFEKKIDELKSKLGEDIEYVVRTLRADIAGIESRLDNIQSWKETISSSIDVRIKEAVGSILSEGVEGKLNDAVSNYTRPVSELMQRVESIEASKSQENWWLIVLVSLIAGSIGSIVSIGGRTFFQKSKGKLLKKPNLDNDQKKTRLCTYNSRCIIIHNIVVSKNPDEELPKYQFFSLD